MIRQPAIDIVDVGFFVTVLLLLGISLLTLFSVTHTDPISMTSLPLYIKQFLWILLGIVVFVLFASIDYHVVARFVYPLYGITIVLLGMVLVTGRTISGARRWIALGPLSFQPSEVAKISLLLVFAKYLSDAHDHAGRGLNLKTVIPPFCLLLLPMLLVLKQPDLGTGLALSAIFFSMIFVLGFRSHFLIYFALLSLMFIPFIGQIVWGSLRDYQKGRIQTFLNPMADPTGGGWHVIQSKIAIGSGGILGKGVGGGTQSQLKFLPESPTDFIFSVFSEEWGLVGIIILLSLFLFLLWWGIDVAYRAKDTLGILMAVGVVGLISYNLLVNVGMALGLLPVVGVPLPLLSYGGTAMITHLGLLGLLLSIKMRRFSLFY